MPQSLALELYQLIIQLSDDKTDVRSLALCCSAFRDEAQRSLFCHAKLASATQQRLFASSINSAPDRLGPLVNTFYSVDWWANHDISEASLVMVLESMCNLKHLELDWDTPSTILQGCRFTLHSFVNHYFLDNSEVLYLLQDFLPTQVRMKHLDILPSSHINELGDVNVSNNLCPQLDSLGTHSNWFISTLLRNAKHISHLRWYTFQGIMPELSIHQLNHLKSIRCRSASILNDTISHHLTSLVNLDLVIEWHDYFHELLQDVEVLKNLPRFRVFIVELVHPYKGLVDEEVYNKFFSFFRHVFELCPSLCRIDVNHDHRGIIFKRLVRQLTGDDGTWVLKELGRFGVKVIN